MRNGWQVKRLDELYEIARGGSPRPIKNFMTTEPDGINWIKISDATASTKYIYETKEKIKPEGIKMSRLVHEGDFILSNSMSFGRPYIMKTTGCIHDGWLVLHAKTNQINNDYMYYLLGSDVVYQQFDQLAAGSTVRNLNSDLVRGVTIPVPPLLEQQRIVAVLYEAFAGIATATDNAEKNLQNARELFESHLQSIFTTKGYDWAVKKLEKLTTKIGSGATPRGGNDSYKSEGVPLVRSLNVHDRFFKVKDLAFIDEAQAKKLDNVVLQKGDVLLNITGASVARCCAAPVEFLPARVNQHVSIIRPIPEVINSAFLTYLLTSRPYKERLLNTGNEAGATRQAITKAQIQNFSVYYPSLPEQQRIVAQLDTIAIETKRLEAIYQQKLDNLAALRQSILQKAFSGELTAKISAQILPFPQKVNAIGMPELHAGIIAAAYQKHKNSPQYAQNFGYVKAEKIVHLAEAWAGIDLERRPLQMPYGPADIMACEAAEAWAKMNNCFTFDKRDTPYQLIKGSNIGGLIEKTLIVLGAELGNKLNKLIQLTLHMGKIETEVLATLFAAWNNRLLNGQPATDAEIILDARDNWHPDKLAIRRSEFSTMLKWMKLNNFVPEGRGKLVKKGALL